MEVELKKKTKKRAYEYVQEPFRDFNIYIGRDLVLQLTGSFDACRFVRSY